MITIGGARRRTKALDAEPGFKYMELVDEATRRGIDHTGKIKEELAKLLSVPNLEHSDVRGGIPGILFHRNLVVKFVTGLYLFVQDFDTGRVLMEKDLKGIQVIGVTSDGTLISLIWADNEVEELALITADELLGLGIEPGEVRTISTPVNHFSRYHEVLGNKLVYTSRLDPDSVDVFDLKTQEKTHLFTGEVLDMCWKDNFVLINWLSESDSSNEVTVPAYPYPAEEIKTSNYTLFNVENGKRIWEVKRHYIPYTTKSHIFFLLPGRPYPTQFAMRDTGGTAYLYSLVKKKWHCTFITHDCSDFGVSKGRLLVSSNNWIEVFEVAGLTRAERFFKIAIPFLSPTAKLRCEELRGGGLICQTQSEQEKEFLLDLDFETIDNVRGSRGKFFQIPPLKAERRHFVEIIASAAKEVPTAVVEIIERFI